MPDLAVLIVDMQDTFTKECSKEILQRQIESQKRVLDTCVEKNIPVIVLEYAGYGKTLNELASKVEKCPKYTSLWKNHDSGFFGSIALEDLLKRWGIGKIYLMGMNASFCVKKTAQDAIRKGFRILTSDDVISDGEKINELNKSKEWYKENGEFYERAEDIEILKH